ncbi:MAG: aminotransferase class III-fold pyridoxal phosphate-dependent enzyme, partial [Gammaproteobacteria bacterium]|nr:aminotransferase class III-fold pyridoxal phosphate-dependent enzyme [Gammaproteobacteria bacterium]
QYPFSVLAMTEKIENLYQKGVYGNTMTTNPRALDIAAQVLTMVTPKVRQNIQQKGEMLVARLKQLAKELGGLITGVKGTGLLVSCELHSDYKCFGKNSIEEEMRQQGLGVIHGGKNSLRFTPHFNITSEEIELIITAVRQALQSKSQTEAA